MPSLEIGCGRNRDPRCDTFMDANPTIDGLDYCGDALGPLPWPDGFFDQIITKDCLEHIGYRKTDAALKEWARVLMPGGLLYVQVPDAERIMTWYVKDKRLLLERLPADLPRTPEMGAAWRLLGGQEDGTITQDGDDWHFNCHYSLFSAESLSDALDDAGFIVDSLEVNVHPNLQVWAHKK